MSLVREALAKAQREAAARAARERGQPADLSALPQPYRARRGRRWPWLLALAVAAIAGGTATVLLLPTERIPFSGSGVPAAAAAAAVAPALAAEEAPLNGEGPRRSEPEMAAVAPVRSGSPAGTPPDPPSGSASGSGSSTSRSVVEPPTLASPPVREERAEPTAPSTATGVTSNRTAAASRPTPASAATAPSGSYVGEVDLGGGRAIRLGGIAWSEAAPLAYLNGRLVGVGEYVEGCRVVAIERDRVRFDGGDEAPAVGFEIRLR